VNIAQTATLAARRAAGDAFADAFGLKVSGVSLLVDDPEQGEPFERTFAPWPVRFYVMQRPLIKTRQTSAPSAPASEVSPRLVFASSTRDGGFIDLAPFGDALRVASSDKI